MATDTQAPPFLTLNSLGLISDAQRDLAQAHPRFGDIAADPDPVNLLVWMVQAALLPEQALAHKAAERSLARRQGEAFEERKTVLEQAMKRLLALRQAANREVVAALCAEGLISVAERNAALRQAPAQRALGSPAAALAWMVAGGLLEPAQFELLRARARAERALPGARARLQIVEQARARLARARRAQRVAFWRQLLPGSPWLWLAGLTLALGGPLWYALAPAAAPACDAGDTVDTVRRMLLQAQAQAPAHADIRPGGALLPAGAPSLSQVSEVGYAAGSRVRGCAARLEVHGVRTPYAYTIAPTDDDADRFSAGPAAPALVAARFGHIDRDGSYGNKAEPLGRDKLERAFRAGVDALRHEGAGARQLGMLEQMRRVAARGRGARERLREIAELEPLGACRPLKGDSRYACRLMIERNDPLLAAIGVGSSTILQGDFTFERAGAAWRVSPAFADELAQTLTRGRGDVKLGMSRSSALAPQQ